MEPIRHVHNDAETKILNTGVRTFSTALVCQWCVNPAKHGKTEQGASTVSRSRLFHSMVVVCARSVLKYGPQYSQVAPETLRGLFELRPRPALCIFDRPTLRWKPALELFLTKHGFDGVVDSKHVVIAGYDLASTSRAAVVEHDEVLDQVQKPVLRQHPFKQRLGVHTALVPFRIAFPLDKVLPLAGDRAIPRFVAVAHDKKCVVVKGVSDAVLIHVYFRHNIDRTFKLELFKLSLAQHRTQLRLQLPLKLCESPR
jgi:hypothetical protein